MIQRNHLGNRIEQSHPRARLNDGQVRNMRHARERLGWSIKSIAKLFRCPYWTTVDIIYYRTRAGA